MTYFQEIKQQLENGDNFSNGNWCTINKPSENVRHIMIDGEYFSYLNMSSYAKRVKLLLNRGY